MSQAPFTSPLSQAPVTSPRGTGTPIWPGPAERFPLSPNNLLEFFLPGRCANCGASGSGEALCPPCRAALPWLAPIPHPEPPESGLGETFAPMAMQGEARNWIHRFKYPARGLTGLDPGALGVARLLARAAGRRAPILATDRIVPIPLHPRRLRRRGFNPAALVAPGNCPAPRQPPGGALARAHPRHPTPSGAGRPIPSAERGRGFRLPSAEPTRPPESLAGGRCDHHRRHPCLRWPSFAPGRRSGGDGGLPGPNASAQGRLGFPGADGLEDHFPQASGIHGFLENHAFQTLHPASLDDVILVVVESGHHQHRQIGIAFA